MRLHRVHPHDSNQLICVLLRPARQCCVDINGIVVYNPNIYLFQFIDERAISVKGHNKLSSRDINWCVICLWPTAVTCINTFPERQSQENVWSPCKYPALCSELTFITFECGITALTYGNTSTMSSKNWTFKGHYCSCRLVDYAQKKI